MKEICAAVLLLILSIGRCGAQDFAAPKAYPIERYLEGWAKNPFTLKTAPAAIQHDSFARDLALGSICQIGEAITVVVINIKTRARTAIYNSRQNAGGITIKSVHLDDFRKGTYVELAAGGESAVLHYDANMLKQFSVPGNAAPGKTGITGPHGVLPPPLPTTAVAKPPLPPQPSGIASASPAMAAPVDAATQAIEAQIPMRLRQRQMNLRFPGH